MVRYKIGFIVDGEALFRMLSKFLPVDDLRVEELAPSAPVSAPPLSHDWTPSWNKQITKPVAKLRKTSKRRSRGSARSLTEGTNGIIMSLMADGKYHRAAELKPLMKAAGFSTHSIGSRLGDLRDNDVLEHNADNGTWRLARASQQTENAARIQTGASEGDSVRADPAKVD